VFSIGVLFKQQFISVVDLLILCTGLGRLSERSGTWSHILQHGLNDTCGNSTCK